MNRLLPPKPEAIIGDDHRYRDLAREAIAHAVDGNKEAYLSLPNENGLTGQPPRFQAPPSLMDEKRAPLLKVGAHVYDPHIRDM
jgi:hypothetical protein